MASELPIVTRLRSSICENKCKAMLASSGCDCAEAADLITELTEALREVIGEVKKTDRRAEKAVRKAVAILAKAGGPINE